MSSSRPDREFVGGLAHGLRVIEAFDEAHPEMTLSEVARRASLTPATARRSLTTLATLGYVRAVKGRYLLAARIMALGSAYLRSSSAADVIEPELNALVATFGDTAGFGVLVKGEVLYVAYVGNPRGMRPVAGAGVTFPAYVTSLGRVLLAGLPEPALGDWLAQARLEKLTERTETDPERLRAILRDVQQQGYATIRDEQFYGVTSLAVPVTDANGTVVAALNTSGYSGMITDEQMVRDRLPHLQATSSTLSRLMARHPALLNSFAPQSEAREAEPPTAKPERRNGRAPRNAQG